MAESIGVFCHTCGALTRGTLSVETQEYECQICHGSFVELPNQDGLQVFSANAGRVSSTQQLHASESIMPSAASQNDVLSGIIGRDDRSSNILSVLQPIVSENGRVRQVGILLQQTGSDNHISLAQVENSSTRGILQLLGLMQPPHFDSTQGALSDTQFENFLHHILMNERSHASPQPAEEHKIIALSRLPVTYDTDISALGECSISQDAFEVGDIVVMLKCGHNFKEAPIVQWLKMHNACPVCRLAI